MNQQNLTSEMLQDGLNSFSSHTHFQDLDTHMRAAKKNVSKAAFCFLDFFVSKILRTEKSLVFLHTNHGIANIKVISDVKMIA
jgi:hypothetical protein